MALYCMKKKMRVVMGVRHMSSSEDVPAPPQPAATQPQQPVPVLPPPGFSLVRMHSETLCRYIVGNAGIDVRLHDAAYVPWHLVFRFVLCFGRSMVGCKTLLPSSHVLCLSTYGLVRTWCLKEAVMPSSEKTPKQTATESWYELSEEEQDKIYDFESWATDS